ncbi:MAG TPA: CHASE domain-containing protein [Stellaceae bacterium]|nr:CHASE domain-containing protein [Stellaceae bacterium]
MTAVRAPGRSALATDADAASGKAGNIPAILFYPLLVVLYVAAGRLGLLLAVPPGYATAIFPPAGIAAAAMLMSGTASLPWVFLGSFLLNVWVGYDAGTVGTVTALAAAVLIAAASTAQAAVTGGMLRRVIGYPSPLDNDAHLLRFLLLSPLCCLTSASLSVGGLWALGVVSPEDFATSWLAWWSGDTLGVLIALPLMLVFLGEPRALWRARLRPVALPMLLFFALFVAIFVRVSAWENDEQMLEFRLVSQQALDKIRTRLEEQEVFLVQLERSFSWTTPISRGDFAALAQDMLRRFPMLQAVEWAPLVRRDERSAFEAAQSTAMPGFEIREVGPGGDLRRAGEHAEFYPVTYVEPLLGNERALGLDLASHPDRYTAVERALATGQVSATRPIRLVQEPDRQAGLLLLQAVRQGANGPGLVLVVLRAGAFINPLIASIEATLHLRLIDIPQQEVLYDNFSGNPARGRYRQQFDFGLRQYLVETEPTAPYLANRRGWQSWLLLSAGILCTGLLGALLLLGTGYTHRIQTQVTERTRDLADANRRLRIEIEERRSAEAALRQAQRMEAIGRLTGGIAHDFNNLLTVVSANAELLRDATQGLPGQRHAAAILRAANRGERLTRQLLAFSRRQTLRPETVDLRTRTGEIAEMLARTMRGDIKMSLDLPQGLWPVAIDPAEFDLAILNVAVNARDAMPSGGQFRVTARNVTMTPGDSSGEGLGGDFVALTLSDTGVGMPPEVQAHAFDPYFTTKDVGAGSGLGLSQVYGFAKQSGGSAMLASKPGAGTSVTLYLPRSSTDGAPPTEAASGSGPAQTASS